MKTSLNRLKSLLQSSATLSYVKRVEFCSPKLLPEISSSQVPYIGIAPLSTSESWVAQRKQSVHTIDLYLTNFLEIKENAIIGDSVKKGLVEVVEDVSSVVRGSFLPANSVNYLSKPIEITNVDYVISGYGDNAYLFVAVVVLQCIRLFNITLS